MHTSSTEPHALVDVELAVGTPTYLAAAISTYDERCLPWFVAIGDLFYGRPGWSCVLTNLRQNDGTDLLWEYGAMGFAVFSIVYEEDVDSFRVHDNVYGTNMHFGSIEDLREWVVQNEHRHSVQLELEIKPIVTRILEVGLADHVFDADVTFDGTSWIATARKLPFAFGSGSSLKEATSVVRNSIAHAIGVDSDSAAELAIQLRLDSSATNAL